MKLARQALRPLLALVILAWIAACGSVNHLRDAQDAFNSASALETRYQFDTSDLQPTGGDAAIVGLASARGSYASALSSLDRIDADGVASLKQDRLWGAVLTLRALCQWRLGDCDGALVTVEAAKRDAEEQLFPRDAALIEALPGLIKIDLAYERILGARDATADEKRLVFEGGADSAGNPIPGVKSRLVGPEGAVADLARARSRVDPNHPVNLYLIQSQLAAYRDYQVAHQELLGQVDVAPDDPARDEFAWNLHDLEGLLNTRSAGEPGEKLIAAWDLLCGQSAEPRP